MPISLAYRLPTWRVRLVQASALNARQMPPSASSTYLAPRIAPLEAQLPQRAIVMKRAIWPFAARRNAVYPASRQEQCRSLRAWAPSEEGNPFNGAKATIDATESPNRTL